MQNIIKPLYSQELSKVTIQGSFKLLGQVLSEVEKELIERYPKDGAIQFGSFRLEGLTQLGQVGDVQQKHEKLIIKDRIKLLNKLEELSSMNELLEDNKFDL